MFEVVDYYADKGVLHAIHGDQPTTRSTELLHVVAQRPVKVALTMAFQRPPRHPQERQPDRAAWRSPGASWRTSWIASVPRSAPGVTTARARPLAEEIIRARGGIPSFIGVPGPPGAVPALPVHLASTRRSCTASRARAASATARSCPSTPAPSSTAGTATRRARSSSARSPERHASSSRRRRAGDATRASRPPSRATTWATSRPRSRTSRCEHGYGVVRSFVGHGIGTEMHEEPQVTNYRTGSRGRRIEPGLCLAIEPMFTLGGHEVRVQRRRLDGRDRDGSLAAHWEHTIAVTARRPADPDRSTTRRTAEERSLGAIVSGPVQVARRDDRCCRPGHAMLWYTPRSCAGCARARLAARSATRVGARHTQASIAE